MAATMSTARFGMQLTSGLASAAKTTSRQGRRSVAVRVSDGSDARALAAKLPPCPNSTTADLAH